MAPLVPDDAAVAPGACPAFFFFLFFLVLLPPSLEGSFEDVVSDFFVVDSEPPSPLTPEDGSDLCDSPKSSAAAPEMPRSLCGSNSQDMGQEGCESHHVENLDVKTAVMTAIPFESLEHSHAVGVNGFVGRGQQNAVIGVRS